MDAARVTTLFITHMHGDHCFGIGGMLRTVSAAREGTPLADAPLHIYGPPGLHRLVTAALGFDGRPLSMPLVSHHPLQLVLSCFYACTIVGMPSTSMPAFWDLIIAAAAEPVVLEGQNSDAILTGSANVYALFFCPAACQLHAFPPALCLTVSACTHAIVSVKASCLGQRRPESHVVCWSKSA